MSDWIKCSNYKELPVGCWLVRVENDRHPFQVAYVNKNKIVVVGGAFHFDSKPLIEYKEIV